MISTQWMVDASHHAAAAVDRSAILTNFLSDDPEPHCVEALLCGFWPFVLGFQFAAKEVVQKCLLTANEQLASLPPGKLAFFASRREALVSIADDEHSHMEMWLAVSAARGYGYRYLDAWKKIPEVLSLRERIINERALADQLIYLLAVELLAGAFSERVLASPAARTLLGETKLTWFAAHVSHGDFSHASLALDAAAFFGGESMTREYLLARLDEFAELYLDADAACVTHVESFPRLHPSSQASLAGVAG